MKISTCGNRGIQLTCGDGQVFSIQFGYGNYCENYNNYTNYTKTPDHESRDCEMASWNKDKEWNTRELIDECENDDVVGYIPIKRALEIVMNYESNLAK